jgi:hypothetical protein
MTRGVYLEPAAVARDPEYAASLAAAGVSIFLLRAGFNPERTAPELERAVSVAEELGVVVWLLAGTWWGHGITAGAETMALRDGWQQMDRRHLLGHYPAHEEQWPMWAPGGSADAAIGANLEQLGRRWDPRGICLTHARFRHPASIRGLFESAPGWPAPPQAAHWEHVIAGLTGMTPRQFAELSDRHDLIGALDHLARRGGGPGVDPTPFTRWFALRSERLQSAVTGLLDTARRAGGDRLIAGTNAIAPHAAVMCGQHYDELAAHADFVQPLLGYMNWHVFQCGAAWARLVRRCIGHLSEAAALAGVWRLFGLDPGHLPRSEAEMGGEGDAATIEQVVAALLDGVLKACPAQRVMPVLRGHDWPAQVTRRLEERIRIAGCPAVFYQGTTVLAGPAPVAGWQ